MILRRVIDHFRKQEWTAIAIDFAIVVCGVFLANQVAAWNLSRVERGDFEEALERFRDETQTNLDTLNEREPAIAAKNATVRRAMDALQTCVDSEENLKAVNSGINELKWTHGLALRRSALDEMTSSAQLLARQSDAQRRRLSEAKYVFDIFLAEAKFLESDPLAARVEDNPIISVGPEIDQTVTYLGVDYFTGMRLLALNVPVSVACKNDALVKDFYSFDYRQGALPAVLRFLRAEVEKNREAFAP